MDYENIGKEKIGVVIMDGSKFTKEVLDWCDLALVTGTTVVMELSNQYLKWQKRRLFFMASV